MDFAAYINAIFNATSIETVLEIGPALRAPFILLANLLVNFHADGETWHAYLDQVWDVLTTEDDELERNLIQCGSFNPPCRG